MDRSRRAAAGKRGSNKASLAALRAAREGQTLRTAQWEAPVEEDVYKEVNEDEYRRIVTERRQREDFVVDDDGLGYYDDGEEHFGEEEEIAKEKNKELVRGRSTKEKDAARKARKLNAERKEEAPVQTNQIWGYLNGGTKAAKVPKKSTAALDNIEALIDSVGTSTTSRTMTARRPLLPHSARTPRVAQQAGTTALARAQMPTSGPSSAVVPRRLATVKTESAPPAAPAWSRSALLYDDDDDEDDEMPPAPPQNFDDDDDVAPPPLPTEEEEEELPSEVKPMDIQSRLKALDAKYAPPPPPAVVVKEEVLVKKEEVATPKAAETTTKDEDEQVPQPLVLTQSSRKALEEADWLWTEDAPPNEEEEEEEDEKPVSFVSMYWLDATVEGAKGTVYLMGKAKLQSGEFVSCCAQVKNVERCLFVLPRINEATGLPFDFGEVYGEISKVIGSIVGSRPFKCKKVKRGYAFGDDDIPRSLETEYLKVKYSVELRPPPASVCKRGGRTFSKILNAGASPLETFILKRKLQAGPCWLRIKQPVINALQVSHCRLELKVEDPKTIVVDSNMRNSGPPPLVVTTLGVKSVVNPKTKHHEVVACVALTKRDVNIDVATNDGGEQEEQRLFTLKNNGGDRRWTMAAVRPLGKDFVSAGVAFSTTLPRDFDDERKKATDGTNQSFLAAKDIKFPNERSLLTSLFTRIGYDDPDVLCGHDITGYALDVLISRAVACGLHGKFWSRLGRLNRTAPPRKWKSKTSNRDTYDPSAYGGRLILDTYVAAKEYVKAASTYSLVSLAKSQLGITSDLPTPFNEPTNVAEALGGKSASGFMVCNLLWDTARDARLTERLALRLQILPLAKQLTSISGNLLARTLKGQRAERIEYLLLHEFHRLKFIPPEKKRFDGDDDDYDDSKRKRGATTKKRAKAQYEGGLVLDPKRGFYDTYILLMDFASLYPSIIQEYDICFTTLTDWAKHAAKDDDDDDSKKVSTVVKKKTKKSKHKTSTPNSSSDVAPREEEEDEDDEEDEEVETAMDEDDVLEAPLRTSTKPTGVLPKVLRSLIAKRREVKALMKKELDPKKKQSYDTRQMALKLTANSMYGCLGFAYSRFYAKPIAALVTRLGRETLQTTANVAEKELSLEVIYGDTDSIMINTRQTDLATVKKLGHEVKRAVNKRYKLLELEQDGIFKSMLLLKKKKYAALVVKAENADGTLELEPETKGLDLVRRDWCELSKRAGRYVLDRLLSGDPAETVVADIHAYLEQLGEDVREKGKLPISDFVITKGLGKHVNDYGAEGAKLPQVKVARDMMARGLPVNVGDLIPHVICKGPGGVAEKAHHPDLLLLEARAQQQQQNGPSAVKIKTENEQEKIDAPPSSVKKSIMAKKNTTQQTPLSSASEDKENKNAETPASVVTPANLKTDGTVTELEIDAEWYLKTQILQSIYRLCEPVEATSKATLASKLGLDAHAFNQDRLFDYLEDIQKDIFVPQASLSDEVRFKRCDPLKLTCRACGAQRDAPLCPKRSKNTEVSQDQPFLTLDCPACEAKLLGAANASDCFEKVWKSVNMAVKEKAARFNQRWRRCDECNERTRLRGPADVEACPIPDCHGTLREEYPEKAHYNQLRYFEALFDPERRPNDNKKGDDQEILDILHTQIKTDVVQKHPYHIINPNIFACFLPK